MTATAQGTPVQDQELQPGSSPQASSTCAAVRHGTRVAYDTYQCRCPDARAASSRARKTRRGRQLAGQPGLVSAVGTTRRLRALSANGWTKEKIAAELGWHHQRVIDLRQQRRPHVNRATHDAVAAVYDHLADITGPSDRARGYARRQGWLVPLWWDDDTIDNPHHDPTVDDIQRKKITSRPRAGRPPLSLSGHVDPVVVERLTDGNTLSSATTAELYAAYVHIRGRGTTPTAAATRLHLSSTARTLFATTYRSTEPRREDVA